MKKSVGVFQNRGVCLQAFPRCPTPSLLLFLFCSRPNFRATRIFTRGSPRGIHSTSFARERLLRRLDDTHPCHSHNMGVPSTHPPPLPWSGLSKSVICYSVMSEEFTENACSKSRNYAVCGLSVRYSFYIEFWECQLLPIR